MFSGRENPTANLVNRQNLFVQIFERKRRIVEKVKQQVDLFDDHLASKCLLAGVSPPSWLWPPSIPSETSELNKEEIISGLLFPQSRPSFICPSGRLFPYQPPVSFLADSVGRQDLTSVVNNTLEEQLFEEEQQHHHLSHNFVRRVSDHSHEQGDGTAFPRDVHEEEPLPEGVSIGCRENESCPSRGHSQNQRVVNSLGATSPGRSQGKMVPESVSTTGCERKLSTLGYCQHETEPDTCFDPGLPVPLEKIQRSKSRQKDFERRSSAKASRSRSNYRNELKPSPGGNIGPEIASLRSDSVRETNLFEHDENDEGCPDEVEDRNSQGKGGDQCIKFSLSTESSTPHQKVVPLQRATSGDASASIVPKSLSEAGHVNEMDVLQTIETIAEVSVKVDEQLDDPHSRSCNETAYLDGGTRSKSSSHDRSKREHQKSSNSVSGSISSRNSDPSHRADDGVELPQVIPLTNEDSRLTDAGARLFQSEIKTRSSSNARRNKSKTGHSGSVKSSSVDLEPIHSISSLQGGDAKESLIPSTIDVEGLVVVNITSDDQAKEKGEGVKESLVPSIVDVEGGNSGGIRSKTEHSGSLESSSVDVEPRHSGSLLQGREVKESPIPSSIDVERLVNEDMTSNDQSKEKGECVKESMIPSTIDIEGLAVEDITRGNQLKGKGKCVDTNICSSAGRISQTGVSTDETTLASAIENSIPKTELLGFVDSSSAELQWRHSVMQSDDESVLLKPVTDTGEALLMEEDKAGESTEVSGISKSRSLSQTDITVVEQVVVQSILQERGTPEDMTDHSKKWDTGCVSKEEQSQGSLTKAGSNQCHGIVSRPRSLATEEKSANEYNDLSIDSDRKSTEEQLKVRAGNASVRTHDLPDFMKPESHCFDDTGERSFDDIPMNSREKTTMEKVLTPASAARMSDVPSLTDSEVNLSADNEMHDTEDHNGLEKETESPTSHCGVRVGENEPPESNTSAGQIDALKKRPQLGISSDQGVSQFNRNIACTETCESHGLEGSIQNLFCSSSLMEGSQLQNKRRRTLYKVTSREPSSNPVGDILDSDSVRETVHHSEEAASHNLNQYDVELQKIIGSASSDHYEVELQKMIGSASSAELRFGEDYLFKEAGLMSPASLSFRPEQSVDRSLTAPNQGLITENMDFLPFAGETSHPFASGVVRSSDCSPCLSPLGLTGADDGSPPVLEGFIVQTDDESQSGSKNQIKHDSFEFPKTTAESATIIEQIRKSACRITPSLNPAKIFKFNEKLDLDQSVSTELFDGMFFSQNLEGSSVFDNLGVNNDYTGNLYTSCLPFSGAGSSADARNLLTSPNGKLWYRSLQKSASSEKQGIQTPDLPCISEENENVDEEPENLCANTPKSMRSANRRSSIPDLPCIAEENEKEDEILEAVSQVSDGSKSGNASAEKKPLADVDEEDPMKFLPSVSNVKIPVDRQSLDSVNTAFSFSATCNNSVKSKPERKMGGSRRFTGKGKENQGGAGAGRNVRPPSSRFSKTKLSCNSSLTSVGPRLPDKEPRHNNIVSNITSFVPLVQQQKAAAAIITGKRDVKVKALEAAEASKRMAEQKENERKMKKEAMKLERARLEQENLRKQEIERKKKEEERKKKEAEIAWKQEMEKKKKEEERKRKEFEMADKKRQREEDKKLKEAKRQRVAEMQRQQKEADEKLQAEKELKRKAMDAKIKALKELKEEQGNARIREARPKSNSSDDTNASRSSREDDLKVISNIGKMSEESYDISPYKCSDDEDEEEDDDDDMSNHKFVPSWASKSNVLLGVISQENRDPDVAFPAKRFRSITKVLDASANQFHKLKHLNLCCYAEKDK
uniref:Inner centromere protein ARK-binding domain-containing protein n=1 Tax=Brassica campestris TaxID=3711 RepID=M4EJJ2_BRACM